MIFFFAGVLVGFAAGSIFVFRRVAKTLVQEAEDAQRCLSKFARDGGETTDTLLNSLEEQLRSSSMTFSQFVSNKDGRDLLFQFLLHKQWVAYNAERLRQLHGKAPGVSYANYTKVIEEGVASDEMNILLRTFLDEYRPFLLASLKERGWVNEEKLR